MYLFKRPNNKSIRFIRIQISFIEVMYINRLLNISTITVFHFNFISPFVIVHIFFSSLEVAKY